MARLRTIKSEFWTSEQVVECSPLARLLFIGLLNFSDDNGRHPASPKRLKMEVFPADAIEVRPLIAELIVAGLVEAYEVQGQSYWQVTGWHKHQKIDKPTYRYPGKLDELTPDYCDQFAETSTSPRNGAETNGNGAETNRAESNGVETKTNANGRPPTLSVIDISKGVNWETARELANEAIRKLDMPLSQLSRQDRRLIIQAAALEQFVERAFTDAVDSTVGRWRAPDRPALKSKGAYLNRAIAGICRDLGVDFRASMLLIDVPSNFLGP